MSIQFRKEEKEPTGGQPWLPPASKLQLEEHLFHFLNALREGRQITTVPLVAEEPTLQAFYSDSYPDLITALRYYIDQFLIELSPDTANWGIFELPPAVFGVGLAVYDCLSAFPPGTTRGEDPVAPFLSALIDTLPPAQTLPEMLAYHAMLQQAVPILPHLPESRARAIHDLIERSPLSMLVYLDLHTPLPLLPLAAELLPGWNRRRTIPSLWGSLDQWLETLAPLLAEPAVVAFLRHRWLTMPETHSACRNLGLLLEALRRRGNQRGVILEYYEAYDYFHAISGEGSSRRRVRQWPILGQAEQLLRVDGASEAVIQLNRRGNEYFFLFYPLLQVIITEQNLPRDYNRLTLDFILAVRSLFFLIPEQTRPPIDWNRLEFSDGDQE